MSRGLSSYCCRSQRGEIDSPSAYRPICLLDELESSLKGSFDTCPVIISIFLRTSIRVPEGTFVGTILCLHSLGARMEESRVVLAISLNAFQLQLLGGDWKGR